MTESRITPERPFDAISGWPMYWSPGSWPSIGVGLGLGFLPVPLKIACAACIPVLVILLPGFFVVEPNLSRVLILFGRYRGTVRQNGFFWTNPFTMKKSLSLRAHNLDGDQIKVNDLMGNPIEISAVVVWRVAGGEAVVVVDSVFLDRNPGGPLGFAGVGIEAGDAAARVGGVFAGEKDHFPENDR